MIKSKLLLNLGIIMIVYLLFAISGVGFNFFDWDSNIKRFFLGFVFACNVLCNKEMNLIGLG